MRGLEALAVEPSTTKLPWMNRKRDRRTHVRTNEKAEVHAKQPQRRRRAPQHIDLFAREPQNAIGNLPASSMLPKEIQVALTSLIPRLLLEHADGRRLAQWRRPIMISDGVRLYHLERKAVLYVVVAHQVLHSRCRDSQ